MTLIYVQHQLDQKFKSNHHMIHQLELITKGVLETNLNQN